MYLRIFFPLIHDLLILSLVWWFELKIKPEIIQSITSFFILLAGRLRLYFTSKAKVKRIGTVLYCLKTISMTGVDLHKNKISLCPQITIFQLE